MIGTGKGNVEEYYADKYNFFEVQFKSPDVESGFGKIILKRNGVTKEIIITDLIWQKGFDGIDDVMDWADQNWETENEIWAQ